MRCPYCELVGHRRAIHGHLSRAHGDRVATAETARMQLSYAIECPECATAITRIVNPRNRDPRFLEENAAEIRLVAFDQLLYHVEAAHPELSTDRVEGAT